MKGTSHHQGRTIDDTGAGRGHRRRGTARAALTAVLAVTVAIAAAAPAGAAFRSSATSATTATVVGDSASDTIKLVENDGYLYHSRYAAGDPGYASGLDFDSTPGNGEQRLSVTDATLYVNGQGGADEIHIDDQNLTTGRGYVISENSVTWGAGVRVQYYDFETLELQGTQAADAFVVSGTSAATSSLVNARGGNDEIIVGSFAGSLDNVRGRLRVYGDTGTDRLTIDDSAATTPHAYGVTEGDAVRGGAGGTGVIGDVGVEDRLIRTGRADDLILLPESLSSSARIESGAGNDTLALANGARLDGSFDGGAGSDLLDHSLRTSPVTVDLGTGTATAVSGGIRAVEQAAGGRWNDLLIAADGTSTRLTGNGGDDVLRGRSGADALLGGPGSDTLLGGGGADLLQGEDGDDRLDSSDDAADEVSCGTGQDALFSDALDLVADDCERPGAPIAPVAPGEGDGAVGGAVGGAGGQPGEGRDATAPTVRGFAASPRRFAPRGGGRRRIVRRTTFRYALSERASVTLAIDRLLPGRRAGSRCVRPGPRVPSGRRCTRFVRVGQIGPRAANAGPNALTSRGRIRGRTLRPGSYRATIVAIDAAGNRGRPRSARFTVVR